MAINLKKFALRATTTLIFVPLFFWIVKYLPVGYFFGLITLVLFLGTFEFHSLSQKLGKGFYSVPAFLMMTAMAASFMVPSIPFHLVLSGGFVLVMLYSLLIDRDIQRTLEATALTFLGVLYLGIPASYMVALKSSDAHAFHGYAGMGADLVFTLFIVVWLGDTGAYLIGSFFGKHKLAPKISPGKSVEGAIANVVFNFIGAIIAKFWFFTRLSWQDVIVISLVVGVTGIMGDLIESMWKRRAGIKDSAGLIPGHGGLLDRLDSFAISAPLMYYYFLYFM